MQFNQSSFDIDTPESWFIMLAYGGFWLYSYYSLIVFLIHLRKHNRLMENKEDSLGVNN